MAAANQNLQNVLQNQTTQQNDRLSFNQTIDGIPRADWNMKDKMELDTSLAEKRYANLDAYSVAQGIAPGGQNAPGGPPAAGSIAIYTSASQNTYGLLMQKVLK